MASTKQHTPLPVLKGLDTTNPTHLVDKEHWLECEGMLVNERGLVQASPLYTIGSVTANDIQAFLMFTASKPSRPKTGIVLVLCLDAMYQLRFSAGTYVGAPVFPPSTPTLPSQPFGRWSITRMHNTYWFTHPNCPLLYTDGTTVKTPSNTPPAARFVEAYYDHLFVGGPTVSGDSLPWRLQWCHLYDYEQWTPTVTNEADHYDLDEYGSADDTISGIMGMRKLGNRLVVYTQSAIIACDYIGLPKIVQINPLETGVGSAWPYGLATHRSSHFFYDEKEMTFFEFGGDKVQDIGQGIRGWIKDNIGTFDGYKVWSFVRPERNEVTWVLPTYKELVFNYLTREWSLRNSSTLSITAFGAQSIEVAKTVNELTGTCNALTGQSVELSTSGLVFPGRLWGCGSNILSETGLLGPFYAVPKLVTGDRLYGDMFTMKETDAISIHASYSAGTGIVVELAARNNLSDTVSYVTLGTWTKTLPHKRLTFPRKRGRIFRWRFTATANTKDLQIYGIQEDIYGGSAEA